MSLRDALLIISGAINELTQSLLDLSLWYWVSAFAVALVLKYIFDCVQIQKFKKRDSELNRINI